MFHKHKPAAEQSPEQHGRQQIERHQTREASRKAAGERRAALVRAYRDAEERIAALTDPQEVRQLSLELPRIQPEVLLEALTRCHGTDPGADKPPVLTVHQVLTECRNVQFEQIVARIDTRPAGDEPEGSSHPA